MDDHITNMVPQHPDDEAAERAAHGAGDLEEDDSDIPGIREELGFPIRRRIPLEADASERFDFRASVEDDRRRRFNWAREDLVVRFATMWNRDESAGSHLTPAEVQSMGRVNGLAYDLGMRMLMEATDMSPALANAIDRLEEAVTWAERAITDRGRRSITPRR